MNLADLITRTFMNRTFTVPSYKGVVINGKYIDFDIRFNQFRIEDDGSLYVQFRPPTANGHSAILWWGTDDDHRYLINLLEQKIDMYFGYVVPYIVIVVHKNIYDSRFAYGMRDDIYEILNKSEY